MASVIVVVEGLYLSDITDTAHDRSPVPTEINYKDIPQYYIDAEQWKTIRTNLRCWFCGFKFNSYPKFIPERVNPCGCLANAINTESNVSTTEYHSSKCPLFHKAKWKVVGNFCTWNCAVAFIDDRQMPNEERQNNLRRIYEAASDLYKTRVYVIQYSPSVYLTKKYCGNQGISDERYRSLIRQREEENCINPLDEI